MRFIHVIFSACNFPTRIFLLSLSPSSLLTNAFPFFFPFSATTGFFLFSSSPDSFFFRHPEPFFIVILSKAKDPVKQISLIYKTGFFVALRMTVLFSSKHILYHTSLQSIAVSGAVSGQSTARLPCRSLPDFDPAIHLATSTLPVSSWILGSSPRMT